MARRQKYLALAPGSDVEYYRDGDNYIMLEWEGRKHKFNVVKMDLRLLEE